MWSPWRVAASLGRPSGQSAFWICLKKEELFARGSVRQDIIARGTEMESATILLADDEALLLIEFEGALADAGIPCPGCNQRLAGNKTPKL
jgi:hypothetical protein